MLTLGIVLEARDFETSGHTHRTARMAERLGEQPGLHSSEISHLRQGAYLHDLGKLCVPDQILRKPGRLTPEEWTIMQSHVALGHDLATRLAGLAQRHWTSSARTTNAGTAAGIRMAWPEPTFA